MKTNQTTTQHKNTTKTARLENILLRTLVHPFYSEKSGCFYVNISRDPMDEEINDISELRKLSQTFSQKYGVSFDLPQRVTVGDYVFSRVSSSDDAYQIGLRMNKTTNAATILVYASPAIADLYGYELLERELVSDLLKDTYG